jgi:ABC-type lipoprotein release transport system permease subunit
MKLFEFSLSKAIIRAKYTAILTAGAVIGVTCLIVINSLFNNYYLSSENIFMGIHPHIQIHKENMSPKETGHIINILKSRFPDILMIKPAIYQKVEAVIEKTHKKKFFGMRKGKNGPLVPLDTDKYVKGTPVVTRYGFTIVKKKKQTFLLKGITVQHGKTVSAVKKIINGSTRLRDLNINRDQNGNPLPMSVYLQQDVFPSSMGLQDYLIRFPGLNNKRSHLLQKGTLDMGTRKGEYPLLVMSIKNARKCLGKKKENDSVNTLEIKLKDPYKAKKRAEQIVKLLDQEVETKTWIQHSKGSFAFLEIIKVMIMAIIFSISVVAAIGMISTLTLIVMQNKAKIAILKSMGIKHSSIYKIFILNTGLTGVTGVIAGTIGGLAVSHLLIRYLGDTLEKLGIKDPHILMSPGDLSVIAVSIIGLFLLTAIIPSRHAIKTDVVQGLQVQ